MSIKFHDITIAGTPELSTLVQAGDNRAVTSAAVNSAVTPKANQTDLADIHQTSPTCTEANGIGAGAYFYLDNVLVQALTAISNGATFTSGTNYTTVTDGALNDLKSALSIKHTKITGTTSEDGWINLGFANANKVPLFVTGDSDTSANINVDKFVGFLNGSNNYHVPGAVFSVKNTSVAFILIYAEYT